MHRLPILFVVLFIAVTFISSATKVLGALISWNPEHSGHSGSVIKDVPGWIQPDAEEGNFFEGDIIFPPYKALNGDVKNLVADRRLLWPGRTLYYQLSNEFSEADKGWIRTAIADLQSVTCVQFVESPGAGAYMLVRNLNGCAAPVGYYGVKTDMFLSATGCRSWGTIQHEFLHALGFWHEHTRPDRDNHVEVMWQNIRPGRTANFLARSPQESQYEGMPYDYGSVMHYRAVAFSRDGSPTIVPLQPGAQIGQRIRYSMIDLAKLNRLYGCGSGYYLGKGLVEGGEEIEGEEDKEGLDIDAVKKDIESKVKEEKEIGKDLVKEKESKIEAKEGEEIKKEEEEVKVKGRIEHLEFKEGETREKSSE